MRFGAVAYLLISLLHSCAAKELTKENWDQETNGQNVFVKFLAPW